MVKHLLLFLLVALCANAAKPNVLIIYFDDTGWTDFGCYGGSAATPHIDQLAGEGMRFTEYYAPAPNCSPSRAGLMTGRFPFRVGMYSYIPAKHVMHLPDSEITIAEVLKEQGYATGTFGKWHLSALQSDQPTPGQQGFDYWLSCDNNLKKLNPTGLYRNGELVTDTDGWAAQVVADEASGWMKKQKAPFFAYVAFSETHSPVDAPKDLIAKYAANNSPKAAKYKAMVEYTDRAVGSLLKSLDDMGVAEDTIVFLASDNGPVSAASCTGLRGRKSFTWEGGVRVPAMIRWPSKVKAGQVYNDPVAGVDLMPTLCDLIGAQPPKKKLDGVSIRPILEGKAFVREAPILTFFYRTSPAASMRLGDWVLIGHSSDESRKKQHSLQAADMPEIKATELVSFELYNVKDDLAQKNDLAKKHPERTADLAKKMRALLAHALAEGPSWTVGKK